MGAGAPASGVPAPAATEDDRDSSEVAREKAKAEGEDVEDAEKERSVGKRGAETAPGEGVGTGGAATGRTGGYAPATPAPPAPPVLGTVLLRLTPEQLEGLRTRLAPAWKRVEDEKAGETRAAVARRVRVLVVSK